MKTEEFKELEATLWWFADNLRANFDIMDFEK